MTLTKKIKIIDLNVDYVDQIYDLFREQFKNEAWNKEQILQSFNSSSTKFYGIFDGCLVCAISILESVDDLNILDIATKQTHKNMGYASALLQHIIDRRKNGQTISLEVKEYNIPAINLYKKFGFKTLSVRKRYYKDGKDALCMFL